MLVVGTSASTAAHETRSATALPLQGKQREQLVYAVREQLLQQLRSCLARERARCRGLKRFKQPLDAQPDSGMRQRVSRTACSRDCHVQIVERLC